MFALIIILGTTTIVLGLWLIATKATVNTWKKMYRKAKSEWPEERLREQRAVNLWKNLMDSSNTMPTWIYERAKEILKEVE